MEKEWFTADELAGMPALPKHKRSINRLAIKSLWQSRTVKVRGGLANEYHLSSLPMETQAALIKKYIPVPQPVSASKSKTDFSYDKDALWAHYDRKPQPQKAEAQRRVDLLLQVMTLVEAGSMTLKNAFAAVAKQHDISARTMQGWYNGTKTKPGLKKYDRVDWLAAAIPGFVGRTATADMDEKAWAFFKADYLRLEQPEYEACYYRLQRAAAEYGWKIPSKKTVERRIKAIPTPTRVFLREGEAGLMKMFPAQQRTVEDMYALEWVNGDGYLHNVFVKMPGQDKPVRLKTWFWQDVYSRKILAYRVDETENTDSIRTSFGDVVEQFGIPEHVTIDNTRAAANKWMTGGVPNRYRFKVKEDDPLGLFPTLDINVHWSSVHAGKGHGQAKPIERAFGVGGLGEYLDKHPKFAGAYTGTNPMAKPENYAKTAVPVDTFLAVIEQEIIAWNAKPDRRTEICAGVKSFDQAFNESYQSAIIRKANKEQCRMWLLMAEAINVRRIDGTFTLDAGSAIGKGKNRYHAPELFEHRGQKVTVRFDPQALHETVYVYTLDNRFICEAGCIEAKGFGDTEASRSFNKTRKQFIKASKAMAKAENDMDVIEAADMLPIIEHTETPNPKIVRPLRPAPQLGRPVPVPQYTEEQQNDYEQFVANEFNQPAPVVQHTDDPRVRYKRWVNLDKRLHDGMQLSSEDQRFWAMYQKGDEFKAMQDFVADFADFDLSIEA